MVSLDLHGNLVSLKGPQSLVFHFSLQDCKKIVVWNGVSLTFDVTKKQWIKVIRLLCQIVALNEKQFRFCSRDNENSVCDKYTIVCTTHWICVNATNQLFCSVLLYWS